MNKLKGPKSTDVPWSRGTPSAHLKSIDLPALSAFIYFYYSTYRWCCARIFFLLYPLKTGNADRCDTPLFISLLLTVCFPSRFRVEETGRRGPNGIRERRLVELPRLFSTFHRLEAIRLSRVVILRPPPPPIFHPLFLRSRTSLQVTLHAEYLIISGGETGYS